MSSTNIQIALKIRPLIEREKKEKLKSAWTVQENQIFLKNNPTAEPFSFDHIFDDTKTNKDLYNAVVQPLVLSCLEGINSTIFAYGQTATGKTHTILGDKNSPGIASYVIEEVFSYIKKNTDKKFLLRSSFLEIYNEKINDLFDTNAQDLKIREDLQQAVYVSAKQEVIQEPSELLSLMVKGMKTRKIGCTDMNERSSRSHTIFKLMISQKNETETCCTESVLSLVDLAGSERVGQMSIQANNRQLEGIKINKSLTALGIVIRKLSENESFINYRDSKLTRLLQESLGGNSKTLVIAAITLTAIEETKSTLEFAQRAKNVKNKPKINTQTTVGDSLKLYEKLCEDYKTQIELLKSERTSSKARISALENKISDIKFFTIENCGDQNQKILPNRRRHTLGSYLTEQVKSSTNLEFKSDLEISDRPWLIEECSFIHEELVRLKGVLELKPIEENPLERVSEESRNSSIKPIEENPLERVSEESSVFLENSSYAEESTSEKIENLQKEIEMLNNINEEIELKNTELVCQNKDMDIELNKFKMDINNLLEIKESLESQLNEKHEQDVKEIESIIPEIPSPTNNCSEIKYKDLLQEYEELQNCHKIALESNNDLKEKLEMKTEQLSRATEDVLKWEMKYRFSTKEEVASSVNTDKELQEKNDTQLKILQAEFDRIRKENVELRGTVAEFNLLKQNLLDLSEEKCELNDRIKHLNQHNCDLNERIEKISKEMELQQNVNANLHQNNSDINRELNMKINELDMIKKEKFDLQRSHDQLITENQCLKEISKKLEIKIKEEPIEIDQNSKAFQDLLEENSNLKEKLKNFEKKTNEIELQLNMNVILRQDISKIKKELNNKIDELEVMRKEKCNLQRTNNKLITDNLCMMKQESKEELNQNSNDKAFKELLQENISLKAKIKLVQESSKNCDTEKLLKKEQFKNSFLSDKLQRYKDELSKYKMKLLDETKKSVQSTKIQTGIGLGRPNSPFANMFRSAFQSDSASTTLQSEIKTEDSSSVDLNSTDTAKPLSPNQMRKIRRQSILDQRRGLSPEIGIERTRKSSCCDVGTQASCSLQGKYEKAKKLCQFRREEANCLRAKLNLAPDCPVLAPERYNNNNT